MTLGRQELEAEELNDRVMEPFPFIVGCGRSGTTLLRAMLDSHPVMAVPPESHFIPMLAHHRTSYTRDSVIDVARFVSELSRHRRFQRWSVSGESVSRALVAANPADLSEAIRVVYRLYAATHGKRRFADKTPRYLLHIPLLAELFSEARFVHILRDGRDVALSLVDIGDGTLEEAALYWKRHVQRGCRAGRRLGPDRYREIRYEDLIADPESVLRSLSGFLALEFEDDMLRYFEQAPQMLPGMGNPQLHRHLLLPPTAGLRDWRRQMSAEKITMFDALAGDVLEDLGYERAGDPSTRDRIGAFGVYLSMRGRGVRRRLVRWRRRPRRAAHGRSVAR